MVQRESNKYQDNLIYDTQQKVVKNTFSTQFYSEYNRGLAEKKEEESILKVVVVLSLISMLSIMVSAFYYIQYLLDFTLQQYYQTLPSFLVF